LLKGANCIKSVSDIKEDILDNQGTQVADRIIRKVVKREVGLRFGKLKKVSN
jgi:hypothetical protein